MPDDKSDDLARSIFLRAKDEHAAARRWAFFVIVFALFLHVTTFSQYLKTKSDLAAARRDSDRLDDARAEVKELAPQLLALEEGNKQALEGLADKLNRDLRADFESLNSSVRAATARPNPASGGGAPDAPDAPEESAVNTPIQGGPAAAPAGREFTLDAGLSKQLRAAADDVVRRRQILLPYIRENILAPRFAEARAGWVSGRLPAVETETEKIAASAVRAAALYPEGRQQFEAVAAGARRLKEYAGGIRFEPPQDEAWWQSAPGKAAVARGISSTEAERLAQLISRDAVEKLRKETGEEAEKAKDAETSLAASVEQIKADFARQQEHAASLAKPFNFISFDIDFLVSRFPILLGLAIGGSLFWVAHKKLELARGLRLLRGRDATARAWYEVFNVAPEPSARDVLVPAAAGALWVLFAAAQNVYWGGQGAAGGLMLMLAGLLPIAFGSLYRWQTLGEARDPDADAAAPAASAAAQGGRPDSARGDLGGR